ncbi:hypothetical protein Lal_00030158, partial [Lupinus albus]
GDSKSLDPLPLSPDSSGSGSGHGEGRSSSRSNGGAGLLWSSSPFRFLHQRQQRGSLASDHLYHGGLKNRIIETASIYRVLGVVL